MSREAHVQRCESVAVKFRCATLPVVESLFHTMKVEVIHGERFVTREAMRQTVFEYIEVDYNRNRRHGAYGYLSPVAFEAKMLA